MASQYESVNAYALERLKSRGDVYGWMPSEGGESPEATLLISLDSPIDSFPDSLAGVRVRLQRVSAPR